jgi:hypothetical protein
LLLAAVACSGEDGASQPEPEPSSSPEPPKPAPDPPPAPAPPDHGPINPCTAGSAAKLPNGQEIWLPAFCNPFTPYLGDPAPLEGETPS